MPGCSVNRCPPQVLHHLRCECGVLLKLPILSTPAVTCTASGCQSVKALTGPADQLRHDSQWQYPMPTGSPLTLNWTEPQKQLPLCSLLTIISLLLEKSGIMPGR